MRRFAWFDCLRFVAIFLVMLAHSRDISQALPGLLQGPFVFLQRLGGVGVDLFFVLSGFLVSGLLFDEHDATGAIDLRRFLIRRAFKIIPAFYVLVLATAIYDSIVFHRVVVVHLIHDLLFLQSYRMGAWPHAWTLAVEVHFYLLITWLLWFLARRSPRPGAWLARLPAILLGVMALSLLARLVNSGLRAAQGHDFSLQRELLPSHLHLDVLAAGVLLRYLFIYRREVLAPFTRGGAAWTLLGVALVCPAAWLWSPHPFWFTALEPTLDALGFGLIVFQATRWPFPAAGPGAWLVKPFDYFGRHSYSIYLWHLPVKQWLVDKLMPGPPGVLYFAVFVGASLAIGSVMSELLEMPLLALRNRLFPSLAGGRRAANPRAAARALSVKDV